jgi:hypothetical protein
MGRITPVHLIDESLPINNVVKERLEFSTYKEL